MLKLVKATQHIAFILSAAFVVSSCGASNGPGAPDPSDPAVGTKLSNQDIVGYFPPPKVGLNYVYVSTNRTGEVSKSTRLDISVTEVNGPKVKLKLIAAGTNTSMHDVDTGTPPVLPPGGLTFEGREQLTIPAGSFNAQKLSLTQNNNTINVWAVKGVGIIKTLEVKANRDTVENVLQSYTR